MSNGAVFFLKDKPGRALLAVRDLDPAYASKVAKVIDSTLSHTVRILSEMEDMGLVKSRPEGRIKRLDLTERGEIVATVLFNLMEALSSSGCGWKKMERLEAAVLEAEGFSGREAAFRVGPFRRDLLLLKDEEEEDLRNAAEVLDQKIVAMISG